MKKTKIYLRIVAMFLILTLVSLCMPFMSVSAIDTEDSTQQIEYTGGWNPPEYPTDGTLYKDRVAVSKTIAPTENENYFDIDLKVVAKPRVIDQSVDVVVVMDVSNTMNSTHEGLGAGAAGYDVKDSRLTHAKSAVNTFLDLYSVDNNISSDRGFGLVTFNSFADTVVPITTMNTAQQAAEVKAKVNSIVAPIGNRERFTNIEGGLQLAHNLLKDSDAVFKYIIFITDGFPTTYIESGRDSKTQITGYDTYMTGAFDASKAGTDGYFADSVTKKICTYGVNYSDKAADRADDVAEIIKNSGINVFSIGIDVGVQSISDYLNSSKATAFTTVDRVEDEHVIGNNAESYKVWLRDTIAGGPMIDNAKNSQEISRYASGNSNTELVSAFENILKDIELLPSESMEQAFTLDPMSDYVEFVNFYNPDGSETDAVINTRNGRDVATFDKDTKTIKWWLTTTQNFYVDELGNYVLSVSYKVRLKNEMEGFEFSKAFPTNGKTSFYFKTVNLETGEPIYGDNEIDYLIPEAEGYVGNFSFTKRDQLTGHPLEGAVFMLEHYGESCHICSGDAVIESLTASSDEAGVVSFENLPSGHEYELTEITPPEDYQPGAVRRVQIAYGKTYFDGKLVNNENPAVITNNRIVPAFVTLKVEKELAGRDLKAGEFTFVLEGEYLHTFHEKIHNDAEGKAEFKQIIFDDEGTYNFRVYEAKGADSTVIYDETVYELEFKVTLSEDSKRYELETKVNGEDVDNDTEPLPFKFTNTLRNPVAVTLSAQKLFDGTTPQDGVFTFELIENGDVIDSKSTVGGIATFESLNFADVGVYAYEISESHNCTDDESDTGIFFDHDVYTAVVTVTAPDDSDSFKAEVVYYLEGKEVDRVVFENFTRKPATLKLNALKIFEGGEMSEGQFNFELRKISGRILDKSENDAEGRISFETLSFDKMGYFVFLVSEVKGNEPDVVYDEIVYKIFVTSETHHNLDSYFIEVTVYENNGTELTEVAHLHGVDLELEAYGGIRFENKLSPAETVTTEPAEPTKATEPATEPTTELTTAPETEPAESTKVTEPLTEPTEATKVIEPETEPAEPTKATEVESEPTEPAKATKPDLKPLKPTATKPQPLDVVQTGDSTNPLVWIAVLFVAGGIFAVAKKSRKTKEE